MIKKLKVCLIILLFGMISCTNTCVTHGIEVSELLNSVSEEKSINYCSLLDSSLNKDSESIKKISLLDFSDAAGYDHGAVLVELILNIGEDHYLQSIQTINSKQKKMILSYLEVGLEYGNNPAIKSKNVNNVFPKVYEYLTEN
ncbi:hypothetical protein CHRYSEOSP005_02740 [Chryseobacterium sp. Alg-005]|uniref:hypothetical protein n=1 Tax=Chryseobacterium sp. Alg-005 TaxID=3159516 RepID=UPI003555775E